MINRAVTWADMWRIPQVRLSFLIRATYDTLPSPRNLHKLSDSQNPSLQHILPGCKAALYQGRYRWRHGRVLREEEVKVHRAVSRDHRPQAEEGSQRPGGGGRTRELLALALKKGQGPHGVSKDRKAGCRGR